MLSAMHLNDPIQVQPHAAHDRDVMDGSRTAVAPDVDPGVRRVPFEACRLPGAARILILGDRTTVSAQIRNRRYAHLPEVAIVGPTCRPLMLTVDGPPPVEIVLSALDWARLIPMSAALLTDRIVPARELGIDGLGRPGHSAVASLEAMIAAKADQRDAADEACIVRLMALIDEGCVFDTATAAEKVDVRQHLLRRLALRSFGFPPKTLLIRRRFLAALDMFRSGDGDFTVIAAFGYFDASHFIRDANRFLGTTPRRFLRDLAATGQQMAAHGQRR